jgi:bile acid:Na+ symporter, BASS family
MLARHEVPAMTLAKIAILFLQASVFLIVFSLGLKETWASATSLLRRPGMLLRSLLSVNIIMPVFAAAIAAIFRFSPAVKISLIFLAISPLPPILPQKQLKLGGSTDYVYGLITALSLFSIFFVPLAAEVLGMVFGRDVHVGVLTVARIVGRTVLLPTGLGMVIHRWAPKFAAKTSVLLGRIGNLMLLAGLVPLLIVAWRPAVSLIRQGDIVAMIAFTAIGVVSGHWLGGHDLSERRSLALATASHHPGLAIAIAVANFPDQRLMIAAAVIVYLLVSALVLLLYNSWFKKRVASELVRSQHRAA